MTFDPVDLTQALIRRPSVTPLDAGAMDVVEQALTSLGFSCRRMPFDIIENLYAKRGTTGPNLCFAGHTDVVPEGATEAWTRDPFAAEIRDGVLIGRGAVDMKGAIAAWIAAVSRVGEVPGTLSFLITGDEEGHATDGTKKVVEALMAEGERIDHCLVGEPTSAARLGDMIKVGRRGSINAWITVHGRQGHVAYPDRASNPIRALTDLMSRLQGRVLDQGYASFPPSNLEITTIDVGNGAMNIIPARAAMRLNIRFNPLHTGDSLAAWISETCEAVSLAHNCRIEVDSRCSGEAFLTEPGPFVEVITQSVEASLGIRPEASTTGGTSDARFIRALCPVVEFGLVGQTMHQIDEAVRVEDLERLTDAYVHLIKAYFERFQSAS